MSDHDSNDKMQLTVEMRGNLYEQEKNVCRGRLKECLCVGIWKFYGWENVVPKEMVAWLQGKGREYIRRKTEWNNHCDTRDGRTGVGRPAVYLYTHFTKQDKP